jgi:glycosyltransferase involved in cell wall biosynthesis
MRILHVDTGADLRGGQHQLLMLLRGLKAQGHEQTLLARGDMSRAWPSASPTASALWRLSRTVDIVHAHDGRSHTLAAMYCWGRPLVVSRRVAFPINKGALSKFKYWRAQKYLAVSQHVREVLLQSGIEPEKISVIYDAVDREDITAAPANTSPRPSGQPLRVLTPRIDDPLKRSDLVEQACKKLGAEVILSTDLKHDIDRADMFVYLSESEGLGSATLLAMARGKPVITSRVGGLPEIVIDESTGLLVDNDVESVAAAMSLMSSDQELSKRCVDKAFQRLSAQFTDDTMVRRTEGAYRSLLRKPQPNE